MRKMVFICLAIFIAQLTFAQKTTTSANTIIAKDNLKIGSTNITKIDTTLNAVVNHNGLPTSLAVQKATVNVLDNTAHVSCGTASYTFTKDVKTARVCRDSIYGNTGKTIYLQANPTNGLDKTIFFNYNTPISTLVTCTVTGGTINSIPFGGGSFNATSITIPRDIQSVTFVFVDTRWEATNIIRAKLVAGYGTSIDNNNVITATAMNPTLQQVTTAGNTTTTQILEKGTRFGNPIDVVKISKVSLGAWDEGQVVVGGGTTEDQKTFINKENITFQHNTTGISTILSRHTTGSATTTNTLLLPINSNGTLVTKLNGQSPDATGNLIYPINSQNLGNSNLSQTSPFRSYSGDTLEFQTNVFRINKGFNVIAGAYPVNIHGTNIYIGNPTGSGSLILGGGLGQATYFADGIHNGASNGKWLKCTDNFGHMEWTDFPTPPTGIAGVTASEGLTVLNGSIPDIRFGAATLAAAPTLSGRFVKYPTLGIVLDKTGAGEGTPLKFTGEDDSSTGDNINVQFDAKSFGGGSIVTSNIKVSSIGLKILSAGAIQTTSGTYQNHSAVNGYNIFTQSGTLSFNHGNGYGIGIPPSGTIKMTIGQQSGTTPATNQNAIQFTNTGIKIPVLASVNNSPGTGTNFISTDVDGNTRVDNISELPFQAPLTSANAGTNISINPTTGVISAIPTLGLTGRVVSISGGNSITLPVQTISKTGSTVTLSDGGGSFTDSDNQTSAQVSYTPTLPITGTDVQAALTQLTALLAAGSKTVIALNPYADNQLIDYSTTFGQNTPAAGLPIPSHLIGKKVTEVGCKIGWLSNLNPMTSYLQVWDASGVQFSQAVSCSVNGAKVTIASPYTLQTGQYLQLVVGSQSGSTVNKGLSAFYTIE